jgi:beta-glucosidase
LDGLHKVVPQARIEFDDGKDIASAVSRARGADVVILGLGERQGISGEGFDRSSLDLPDNQEQLLEAVVATGKPVILVLENGRPLTIPWARTHVQAILEAWYPGEFGGQAIAETLFGDNDPRRQTYREFSTQRRGTSRLLQYRSIAEAEVCRR